MNIYIDIISFVIAPLTSIEQPTSLQTAAFPVSAQNALLSVDMLSDAN